VRLGIELFVAFDLGFDVFEGVEVGEAQVLLVDHLEGLVVGLSVGRHN
jgi:hypothetical protein